MVHIGFQRDSHSRMDMAGSGGGAVGRSNIVVGRPGRCASANVHIGMAMGEATAINSQSTGTIAHQKSAIVFGLFGSATRCRYYCPITRIKSGTGESGYHLVGE